MGTTTVTIAAGAEFRKGDTIYYATDTVVVSLWVAERNRWFGVFEPA